MNKRRLKPIPKDDGLVNYCGRLMTPNEAKAYSRTVMSFSYHPLWKYADDYWENDPSYHWKRRKEG